MREILRDFGMNEKEREIKKVNEGGNATDENDEEIFFAEEVCRGCEKLSYCIPFNCAGCEFRTNCTYVYESF